MLPSDGFVGFRNKCPEIYEIDPAHFLSAPRLVWAAMFKGYRSCTRINSRCLYVTIGRRGHHSWNISCRTQAYNNQKQIHERL